MTINNLTLMNKDIFINSMITRIVDVTYRGMKKKIKLLAVFTASIGLILLIFVSVNPEGRPLIFIFLPVLLLWAILYSGISLLLEIFVKKTTKAQSVITFVGTSLLVLLFLLSGVGQLTLRDIVLVVSLGIIGSFYFYRTWV